MTSVFADCIKKTTRTVYLNKEDELVVEDELVTGGEQAMVTWIMVTPADARIISKNQIELTEAGQRMLLTVTSLKDVEMKIWSNTPSHDYDESNPESIRVGFETRLPADRKSLFKTTLVPIG